MRRFVLPTVFSAQAADGTSGVFSWPDTCTELVWNKRGKRHTCWEPFAAWEEIKTTTAWEEKKATAPGRKSGYLCGGVAAILFFIILEGLSDADCAGRVHCLLWVQHVRHPPLAPCYKQRLLSALFPHLVLISVSPPSRQCCLYCFYCHLHPGSAVCIVSTVTSIQAVLFALFPLSHPSRQCCLHCFHCHIHPGSAVCIVSTVTSIQAVLFVLFPLSPPSRQCCLYCFHCHLHPGSAVCMHSCTRTIKYHPISMHQLLFLLSHPVRDPLSAIPTRLEIQSGIPVKVNTQSGIPAKLDSHSDSLN